jgi:D-sedoheptulose 7-phosphate isomerase
VDDYQIIAERFQGTIESIAMSVDSLAAPISQACELMAQTLLSDGKIITCGNGADSAQAQLYAATLLCALEQERPALPALHLGSDCASLTAIAASESGGAMYAQQLRALGQENDTLLLINSGEPSPALAAAIAAAHERNMRVVALSNTSDTRLPGLLLDSDELLLVEARTRSQTIELQTMILLCLCQLIENKLFGGYTQE